MLSRISPENHSSWGLEGGGERGGFSRTAENFLRYAFGRVVPGAQRAGSSDVKRELGEFASSLCLSLPLSRLRGH